MGETRRVIAKRSDSITRENPPGIRRTTLSYNEQTMLCHFLMKKGAKIPLHNHEAVQNGYIVGGRVRFILEDGSDFTAEPGTGYCFDSMQKHGAEVLEDSEVIETFSPMRPEYADAT